LSAPRQRPSVKISDIDSIDSAEAEMRVRDHPLGYTTIGRVPVRLMNEDEAVRALSYLEFHGGTVEQQQFVHDYEMSRGLMNSHTYLEEKKLVRIICGKGDEKFIDMTEKGKTVLTNSKIAAGMKSVFG